MFKLSLQEINNHILGLNYRNLMIIKKRNPRKYKKIADDKLLCKSILRKNKVKTPELFKIIRTKEQLEYLDWENLPKSFVIKPNRGTHGSGIIVFYGKKKKSTEWIMPNMQTMAVNDIKRHITDILDGKYAMDGKPDVAFFEERIKNHDRLKPYSYRGIPDIRIIVYNGFPIMAELRLPTRESRGTANLHAGGIGVGIDIATGVTTTAIHRKGFDLIGDQYDLIDETLDEPKLPLRGIKIPYWDKILELAIRSQQISKLGFIGTDIVIDREKGPLILELNARPGLAIQIANQEGLKERIMQVKDVRRKTIIGAISLAKSLFGGEIEEQVESLTGKEIIGLIETVTVSPIVELVNTKKQKNSKETVKAKIDTGALRSSMDYNLAIALGYSEIRKLKDVFEKKYSSSEDAQKDVPDIKERVQDFQYITGITVVRSSNGFTIRPVIEAELTLGEITRTYQFTVSDRSSLLYPVILGRSDLGKFLIDPTKTFTKKIISHQ